LDTKVGIFTRVERFIVLAPCLIINQPMIALWATAILANITAVQRILHVRKQASLKQSNEERIRSFFLHDPT
jgi:CDP-diacylglycerol--glycerol-3-phosphate 3-phosphatidyltransferase